MSERRFQQVTNNLGSVMKHDFSKVPAADIPRSSFNRSHAHKTTFNEGYLIPILIDEVLPGDTINLEATFLCRMATPIYPLMDNLFLDSFFFFVPRRLCWPNFEKQWGLQKNPGDSTDYVNPTITFANAAALTTPQNIFDYMGLTMKSGGTVPTGVCAEPFIADCLIYDYWFRDQNLINSVTPTLGDGPYGSADFFLKKRGKRHDYFTSALPWPQKGDAVTLPLGVSAPVKALDATPINFIDQHGNDGSMITSADAYVSTSGAFYAGDGPHTLGYLGGGMNGGDDLGFNPGQVATLYTDLSTATAATINSIRFAFQMQKLLERDARGGTRFPEILQSHWGVTSPDARVQWPEYLGGGESPVVIHPVVNTAGASGAPVQGNVAGFGVVASHRGHNHGFTKSFVEPGWLLGYVSVRADLTYQQGIERMWWRSTRFDSYWPVFAHLGEQAILNREIYHQGSSTVDAEVFGYQEAWAEYRYKPSRISGYFRSTVSTPLDAWHLSQKFTSLPTLSQTFIEESAPMSRVEAVTNEADFIFDAYFKYICARPMPTYSVPGLVDHF